MAIEGTTAAVNMDRIYRHQRRIYDASRAYYLLGRDQLLRELNPPPDAVILEIACGTARNLLRAADLYPGARLYGVDISSEMLTTARASIAKSRHSGRIKIALADATSFETHRLLGIASADRIFISYAVSMIPRWMTALDEAVRRLAPGGSLHIVDFGTMQGMPAPARRALVSWLARFDVTPRRSLETTCQLLAARHGLKCTFHQSPRGYFARAVISAN
ncbi:MAG: class I SAM-dependent methyltransferase [Hyphomicrobium sp.]